jgi:serine/threonine protein kinase
MGRYVPFARIGSGGMAEVYLAVARGPVGLNKLAVLKRVKHTDDPAIVQMFLDEARLAARLNHPNIVHTYEVGEVSEKFFIAMEYLEGQSLHAVLARRPELTDGLVAYVMAQALRGLHHAHELRDFDASHIGVVHRDVSPHNIHVTYGGEVKLLDFGIAKTTLNSTHTETGILKGKIRYMAPEQFGEPDVDRRADLFACGVVLWEMLTRRQLFQGEFSRVMNRIVNEDAPSVRSIRPDVAPELEAIAAKALRRNRDERYATADAMRLDLEQFLRGRGDGSYDKEVAAVIGEAFTADRDDVRAKIKAFVDGMAATDGTHNPSAAGTPSGADLPVLGMSADLPGGSSAGGGIHRLSQSAAGISASMPVEAYRARRRFPAWTAAALGVLALGGVAAFGHGSRVAPPVPAQPAAAPQAAHLTLGTTPAGALVELGGKTVGTTPLELELQPGPRVLKVSADGYEVETLTLDVRPGVSIDRALQLRPVAPPAPALPAAAPVVAGGQSLAHGHPRAAAPPKSTSSAAPPRVKIRVLDDTDSP